MTIAAVIIASFDCGVSGAKDLSFKRRFLEMAGSRFGVAAFGFRVGWILVHSRGTEDLPPAFKR